MFDVMLIYYLLSHSCVIASALNVSEIFLLNPHHNPMRYNEILGITTVPVLLYLHQQAYKLFKLAPYHV